MEETEESETLRDAPADQSVGVDETKEDEEEEEDQTKEADGRKQVGYHF